MIELRRDPAVHRARCPGSRSIKLMAQWTRCRFNDRDRVLERIRIAGLSAGCQTIQTVPGFVPPSALIRLRTKRRSRSDWKSRVPLRQEKEGHPVGTTLFVIF
jgi:hypothetical protein